MGRKSYEQAGGGVSPFKTYVAVAHVAARQARRGHRARRDALERIAALREQPGKDIWLWGGGELFGSLAAAGLVDTVEIGVVPVLLGAGRKVMAGCASASSSCSARRTSSCPGTPCWSTTCANGQRSDNPVSGAPR